MQLSTNKYRCVRKTWEKGEIKWKQLFVTLVDHKPPIPCQSSQINDAASPNKPFWVETAFNSIQIRFGYGQANSISQNGYLCLYVAKIE